MTKWIEYLNFFLLCILLALIFYLHVRVKRYLTLLKMAEEIFSGCDAPKRQKLLECILTGNSKLYLGKVFTEEKIKELSDEEVDKLFNNYEAKFSGGKVFGEIDHKYVFNGTLCSFRNNQSGCIK